MEAVCMILKFVWRSPPHFSPACHGRSRAVR